MIDFDSLVGVESENSEFDLMELFRSLDVKSTHTEPRPAQIEAMEAITKRKDDKDIVLKVSTGAGKTTVGLLFLYGHMKTKEEPVVYLCPTQQLVDQVLKEANRLGISAQPYLKGVPHPHSDCMRAKSVIVCTYEKMFNAKSTFHRRDVNLTPCAIVLDDAHAGVESIRKQFTLRLEGEAFDSLIKSLKPAIRSYSQSKWDEIESADPTVLFEVPHWIISDNADEIRRSLQAHSETASFPFVWPYLKDNINLCRCVVSGRTAEIVPEIVPIRMVSSFDNARHKLYMSATLADDSVLTRELGATKNSALNPIMPPADRGLGERMIVAPSLIDSQLDRDCIINLSKELSEKYNVVVLTSSARQADDWIARGARYYAGEEFSDAISLLKDNSTNNFVVFAQRFDGVDLPDDSCRILIIDGVPQGESLIDKTDAQLSTSPGGARNKITFKLEQGMGRAVRSHADYSVVILVGDDLTTYVARKDILASMTLDTQKQLKLSDEIASLASGNDLSRPEDTVSKLITQCLTRDDGWKRYYNLKVRSKDDIETTVAEYRVILAEAERAAYMNAMDNNVAKAMDLLQRAINDSKLSGDELGGYLQVLSRIVYLQDPVKGLGIQRKAREQSMYASLPPEIPHRVIKKGTKTAAQNVCEWFNQFDVSSASLVELNKIRSHVDFACSAEKVEQGLQLLGAAIGAGSSRPEKECRSGPDNLWHFGTHLFVIEAKTGNQHSLHKSDSGQLHNSLSWAEKNYPEMEGKVYPIIIADVTEVDSDANFPLGSRVITSGHLEQLLGAMETLCQKFIELGPVFVCPDHVVKLLPEYSLTPDQLLAVFTQKL